MAYRSEPVVLPVAPDFWGPAPGSDGRSAAFAKEERIVVGDGTPIVYALRCPPVDAPSRPPLMFVSGVSCSDAYWAHVVPRLLAAGHICVVADARGQGGSGLPRPPGRGARDLRVADLSVERMARDLLEVLDDAGVDRAVLVGHSTGAHTVPEAFRIASDRVLGMVLVAGASESPIGAVFGTRLVNALLPVGRALVRNAPEVVRPIWPNIARKRAGIIGTRLAGTAGRRVTADALQSHFVHLAEADPAVLLRAIDALRYHSATDLLPRIDVPVLLLGARRDTFTPPRCTQEMSEQIPESEVVWFDDAGHTLPLEEPDAVVEAIEEWCAHRVLRRAGARSRQPV